MNIVALHAAPKAASDLSARLRECADAVDRGEVVSLIAAYIQTGEYQFLYSANLQDSLILATLMQNRCVEKFKE